MPEENREDGILADISNCMSVMELPGIGENRDECREEWKLAMMGKENQKGEGGRDKNVLEGEGIEGQKREIGREKKSEGRKGEKRGEEGARICRSETWNELCLDNGGLEKIQNWIIAKNWGQIGGNREGGKTKDGMGGKEFREIEGSKKQLGGMTSRAKGSVEWMEEEGIVAEEGEFRGSEGEASKGRGERDGMEEQGTGGVDREMRGSWKRRIRERMEVVEKFMGECPITGKYSLKKREGDTVEGGEEGMPKEAGAKRRKNEADNTITRAEIELYTQLCPQQ